MYSFRNYTNQQIEIRTDDLLTCTYTNQEKIDYINSLVKVTTMTKSGNIIIGLNKPITIGASGILSLNM